MSQEQYDALLSNLLREKRTLAKLREELEGRKGKLCRSCPLWEKKVKRVACPDEGKAHQKEKKREVR